MKKHLPTLKCKVEGKISASDMVLISYLFCFGNFVIRFSYKFAEHTRSRCGIGSSINHDRNDNSVVNGSKEILQICPLLH